MSALSIRVTAADIRSGKPHNGNACPIALALRRHGYTLINIYYIRGPGWTRMELPREATTFMLDFDLGLHVEPFTMVIR